MDLFFLKVFPDILACLPSQVNFKINFSVSRKWVSFLFRLYATSSLIYANMHLYDDVSSSYILPRLRRLLWTICHFPILFLILSFMRQRLYVVHSILFYGYVFLTKFLFIFYGYVLTKSLFILPTPRNNQYFAKFVGSLTLFSLSSSFWICIFFLVLEIKLGFPYLEKYR